MKKAMLIIRVSATIVVISDHYVGYVAMYHVHVNIHSGPLAVLWWFLISCCGIIKAFSPPFTGVIGKLD